MATGALYRSELATNLQKLGYGIHKRSELDADGQETGRVRRHVVACAGGSSKANPGLVDPAGARQYDA